MKDIYFITSGHTHPMTGGEQYNYNIMKYLESKDLRVHIFEASNAPKFIRNNSLIRKSYLIYNIYLVWRFRNLSDIILIISDYFYVKLALFNFYVRYFKNFSLLGLTHHLMHYEKNNKIKKYIAILMERVFFKKFKIIITVSKQTKKDLIELGINNAKIVIVPNGIDETLIQKKFIRKSMLDKVTKILFVGVCVPRKGLEYLIEAVAILGREYIVTIIGNDKDDLSYANNLKNQVKRLDLGKKVFFLGRISKSELYKQYEENDIFVLPSLWEGYGVVLMEALAFGLPVVATNVGAIPELIVHKHNGLLVPAEDSKKLSEALKNIIDDPTRRKIYGDNTRRMFEKKAQTWDSVGRMFLKVLDSLN